VHAPVAPQQSLTVTAPAGRAGVVAFAGPQVHTVLVAQQAQGTPSNASLLHVGVLTWVGCAASAGVTKVQLQ